MSGIEREGGVEGKGKGRYDYVVSLSGGASSAASLLRLLETPGVNKKRILPIFMDTLEEHLSLYAFLDALDEFTGLSTLHLRRGLNLWQVADSKKFMPNNMVDSCSDYLKRKLFYEALKVIDPAKQAKLVFGFTADEVGRIKKLEAALATRGYTAIFPLLDDPEIFSADALVMIQRAGLPIPALYSAGFDHNNCGGFCFKAGQKQFAQLYKYNKSLYLYHAMQELRFQLEYGGSKATILRDRRGKKNTPLSLLEFAARLDAGQPIDEYDIGYACDCMGVDNVQWS